MAVYASRRAGYPPRPGNYRVYNNVDCKRPASQARGTDSGEKQAAMKDAGVQGCPTVQESSTVQECPTVQECSETYVHESRCPGAEQDRSQSPQEPESQQEACRPESQQEACRPESQQEAAGTGMPDLSALISSLGGAEGISATINSLLSGGCESPDTNASAHSPGPAPQSDSSPEGIDLSSLLSGLGGANALGGLGNLAGLGNPGGLGNTGALGALGGLGNTGGILSGLLGKSGSSCNSSCSRLCTLTSALCPFLSPGRRGRADKMLKIMQLLAASEQPVFDDDRLPLIMIFVYLFF